MKAIIIPGSLASVLDHEKIPWITNLIDFIKKIVNHYKHIKLLGICFGSQIIAQSLGGGECEKMPLRTLFIGKE